MSDRTNSAVWLDKYARWQIKVQKDGVRKTFTSSKPGRTGQREANAKADRWLREGMLNQRAMVRDIVPGWFAELEATTSKSNYVPVERRWKKWVAPLWENKKIANLTEQDLQNVLNCAYATGPLNKQYENQKMSKKTLQNMLYDMKAFLKYCRRLRLTTFFPEDVQVPHSARLKGKIILQPNDLIKLFSSTKTTFRGKEVDDDLVYAYRLIVATGMRPGECRALKWNSITHQKIKIVGSINIYNEHTLGKNENSVRGFEQNDLTRAILGAQKALTGESVYVFPIRSEEGFLKRWKRFCEANDMTSTTLYELRHTFVSVVQTLPEGELKPLIGHSKVMDTFGTYGHEVKGYAENTAQKVNSIFLSLLEKQKDEA